MWCPAGLYRHHSVNGKSEIILRIDTKSLLSYFNHLGPVTWERAECLKMQKCRAEALRLKIVHWEYICFKQRSTVATWACDPKCLLMFVMWCDIILQCNTYPQHITTFFLIWWHFKFIFKTHRILILGLLRVSLSMLIFFFNSLP